jgi:hypothetical protein
MFSSLEEGIPSGVLDWRHATPPILVAPLAAAKHRLQEVRRPGDAIS